MVAKVSTLQTKEGRRRMHISRVRRVQAVRAAPSAPWYILYIEISKSPLVLLWRDASLVILSCFVFILPSSFSSIPILFHHLSHSLSLCASSFSPFFFLSLSLSCLHPHSQSINLSPSSIITPPFSLFTRCLSVTSHTYSTLPSFRADRYLVKFTHSSQFALLRLH